MGNCTIRNAYIDVNYNSSIDPAKLSFGILIGGDLDIIDSTVEAKGDSAICANDNFNISSSIVNAESASASALRVNTKGMTITNNSTVYASSDCTTGSHTIRSSADITIENSSVVAISKGDSVIHSANGSINITNAEVSATTSATYSTSSKRCAVYASKDIKIDNSKLTATSKVKCHAIYSNSGSLEIKNNSEVEATSQSTYSAVEVSKAITVTGSKLTASSKGIAITANNQTLEITNGSDVEGTTTGNYKAVYAKNGITVEGSGLSADSGSNYAISTDNGSLLIKNGSTVTANTGGNFEAVWARNGITVEGSKLTANSAGSNAINTNNGSVSISGSEVEATTQSTFSALFGSTGITIDGSRIYAESAGSAINSGNGAIRIKKGSDVTAISPDGVGYPAIYAYGGNLEISSSTVDASGCYTLYSTKASIITDSFVKSTTVGNNTIYGLSGVTITGSWFESYGGSVGTSAAWEDSVNFKENEGTVIGNYVLIKDTTISGEQTLNIPAGTSVTVPTGLRFSNQGHIVLDGDFNKEEGAIIEPCANHVYNNGNVCLICGYVRCYDITATAGEGGSINPTGTVTVMAGQSQIFEMIPDNGYRVSTVLVDGEDIGDVKSYTFTNVQEAHSIEVTFERLPFNLPEIDNGDDEPGAEWDNPFTDVSPSDWWYEAVEYVEEHGIMSGVSDTDFAPNADLSRAMVVQILYNLEGTPAVSGESTFSDAKGHWAADAIAWAERAGLVSGYEDNSFRPDAYVTREELAQMLYNYAGFKGYDVTASGDLSAFTDGADVQDWAVPAMSWACGNELITGFTDGSLRPSGTATRAQAATILMAFETAFAEEA